MRNEFLQASAPGEPLVMSAWRYIDIELDAQVLQLLRHLLGAKVLLRTTAHKHILDLAVELIGIGKHAIEAGLHVHAKERTTEGTEGRELIHIVQYGIESLASTP